MIYSRFGNEVKEVVGGDTNKNEIDVIFENDQRKDKIFKGYITDFKADGGLKEIADAINAANLKRKNLPEGK